MGCTNDSNCVATRPPCCATYAFSGSVIVATEQNPFPIWLANDVGGASSAPDHPSYPIARASLVGALAVAVSASSEKNLGDDKLVFQLQADGVDFGLPVEFTGVLASGLNKGRSDFQETLLSQDSLLTLKVTFVSAEDNNPPTGAYLLTATAA